MLKKSKSLVAGALAISLVSGGVGVYAGTVIDSYKSPRGHIVTVEPVNVHKNRIGLSVNGKEIETTTWYADGVSYAPVREVAEMLGASVNYDPKTVSGDIVTESKLLDLLGLKLQVPYTSAYTYKNSTSKRTFTITSFNPTTNLFEGKYEYPNGAISDIKGKITENNLQFTFVKDTRYDTVLTFNGNTKTYTGVEHINGTPYGKYTISLE